MKIAIYARVSTEKQEKQATIQSQLSALREFATKNNHIVIEEFTDDGYSGELLDRPALDKLRDVAKKKVFEAVLVHSPDRLSRNYVNLILTQNELKKHGVVVTYLNRPDSKNTPEDVFSNGIQGLVAEYEKAKILERTRRGRIHKARNGLVVTSMAPYGYRYIRMDKATNVDGHYEIIEDEARVVKKIFDLFVNKQKSIRAIARCLTNEGIKPQRGKLWRSSSLHRIIRNETYAGITYYNKNYSCEPIKPKEPGVYKRSNNTSRRLRQKNEWIPIKLANSLIIIEKEMFDRAQRQLKINAVLSPRNVKNQYLLRGVVGCGKCGSPLFGTPCHGKLYYRCGNRCRTFPLPRECKVKMVSAPKLESTVWDAVCNALKNPALIVDQIKKRQETLTRGRRTLERSLSEMDRRFEMIKREDDKLLDAYREGIITMTQLKDQMPKIQEKKDILAKEREDIAQKLSQAIPAGLIRHDVKHYCKIVSNRVNSANFEQKQQIMRIVKRVIIDEDKVKIKAIIPSETFPGSIASTPSGHCGHREVRSRSRG